MAEETNGAVGTLAEPNTQPPAGIPPSQAESGTGEQSSAPPESISLDEARKLRSEAQSLRKRLKDYEEAQKAADEAKLSETERTALKVAELERKLADRETAIREQRVLATTVENAARLGYASPRLAYRLLDHSAIEFDEDGAPVNVESLLRDLLRTDPYLAASHARPTGSIDGGTRGSPGLTLEQINRMTPEEHEKRRDEVMAFLAARK
jgi:hypothetical protein